MVSVCCKLLAILVAVKVQYQKTCVFWFGYMRTSMVTCSFCVKDAELSAKTLAEH